MTKPKTRYFVKPGVWHYALLEYGERDLLLVHATASGKKSGHTFYPIENNRKIVSMLRQHGFNEDPGLKTKADKVLADELVKARVAATMHVTMAEKTEQEAKLRRIITKPQKVTFWGQEHVISPAFASSIIGDGKYLLGFQTMDDRPNYHVIRVDSSWGENPEDKIDEVLNALEEEFGEHWTTDDEGRTVVNEWPAVNAETGFLWFGLDWPEGFEPEGVRQKEAAEQPVPVL